MKLTTRIAGLATGTLLGVGIALSVTTQPAQSALTTDDGPTVKTYCQWSLEPDRKVLVIAENMDFATVDVGHIDSKGPVIVAGGYPEFRRIPERLQLAWIQLPKKTQEDEIGIVQAEMGGEWRICEPS